MNVQIPTAPAAVRSALACLAPELPRGARVIVFGSYADGDARTDSDIDLLVIEPDVTDRTAEMVRLSHIDYADALLRKARDDGYVVRNMSADASAPDFSVDAPHPCAIKRPDSHFRAFPKSRLW